MTNSCGLALLFCADLKVDWMWECLVARRVLFIYLFYLGSNPHPLLSLQKAVGQAVIFCRMGESCSVSPMNWWTNVERRSRTAGYVWIIYVDGLCNSWKLNSLSSPMVFTTFLGLLVTGFVSLQTCCFSDAAFCAVETQERQHFPFFGLSQASDRECNCKYKSVDSLMPLIESAVTSKLCMKRSCQ